MSSLWLPRNARACFVLCIPQHAWFDALVVHSNDARLGRVLAAGTGVTSYKQVRLGAGSNQAHSKPVVAVLFNPMFHQVWGTRASCAYVV